MKRFRKIFFISIILVLGLLYTGESNQVYAATTPKAQVIKKGQRIDFNTKNKYKKFKSSNSAIAYVNSEGIVTGKTPGTATITLSAKNRKTKKISVKVLSQRTRPNVPVIFDEISTCEIMTQDTEGNYHYSVQVKNGSKKGTIKKIEYIYKMLEPETKTVSIVIKNIKPGKESKLINYNDHSFASEEHFRLQKILLYTGNACYIHNVQKDTYRLTWGVPDKTPPEISGWVKENSHCNGEAYLICYSDKRKTYSFTDYIEVKDRDRKTTVSVNTNKVNWKKDGFYKVYFTAKDSAGNKTKSWMKIQVIVPSTAESVADSVLSDIIKKSWSDKKKAIAIHDYTKNHCSYVDMNTHTDWRKTGLYGIRYGSGDCFTYASISRLLLSRAGIPNLTVQRYPNDTFRHWWNLVYIEDYGWYHLDTTPRMAGGRFCLTTDSQMWSYDNGVTFRFKSSSYPDRGTKKIGVTPRRDRTQR